MGVGHDLGELAAKLVVAYREHDLLTYASAISFQVLFALIPLALLALGLLGVFHLEHVWRDELAPHVRDQVSRPLFAAIDDTAKKVLEHRQLLWVTFGAGFAVWQVSGAVRAVMGVFNRIYGAEEGRPFVRRIGISLALALAETLLVLLAIAVVNFGPKLARQALGDGTLPGVAAFVVPWCAAIGVLLLVVGALVRFAPAKARPWRWVSLGSGLVVLAWVAMSLLFGLYLRDIADYRSIFGSLATLIVVMEYLYIAAIVFLTGIQLDSLLRDRVAGPGRGS